MEFGNQGGECEGNMGMNQLGKQNVHRTGLCLGDMKSMQHYRIVKDAMHEMAPRTALHGRGINV